MEIGIRYGTYQVLKTNSMFSLDVPFHICAVWGSFRDETILENSVLFAAAGMVNGQVTHLDRTGIY
jgi:hypothetical protein